MKKVFFKALSVILSLTIIFSTIASLSAPSFASDEVSGTDIPLIYIAGQGASLCRPGESTNIYPISIPDGYIEQAVKDNIGVFAKAVITQKWEEFGGVIHDILSDFYGELALDENGHPKDGSSCRWSYTKSEISAEKVNGKYPTERYDFLYDWRLDPYEVAEQLHQYIEDVREVTGADKVALLGRCLGGCVSMAYMEKYDAQYISDYIQYCTALNGATQVSECFAGDIYLDSDSVERFVYDLELSGESYINELLQSFVTLFNKTYGLDLTCAAVNNVYPDIYLDIIPQVLIDTLGTFPGFWSMVSDRDYEKAKQTVFHDADMDKYSDFIKKIDNYHYNVQNRAPQLLKEYSERGIDIANVSKYGVQTIPISYQSDIISDGICSLPDASFGATTADIDSCFSKQYIYNAKTNGTEKYIAPDLQVDASTCLFPEKTWFIKDLGHKVFPHSVDKLFDSIINNDDFTVNSNPVFPQYLVYQDNGTDGEGIIVPMTKDNCNTAQRYFHTFWEAFNTFLKSIIYFININIVKL